MVWTATHRFAVLALHVAHQGDGRVQEEERQALAQAALRLGVAADVPQARMMAMVTEAEEAFAEARAQDRVQQMVAEAVESLGGTFPAQTCAMLLRELRQVAMAHGGVNPEEHRVLSEVREAWGIRSIV